MMLNRRSFLKAGAAGFGSILLMPSCVTRRGRYSFFTDAEADCVIAMCEQIIPAEEEFGGGATEAGVIHYIDRQLVAVFTYDQLRYQRGISALQESALELHQKPFEALDAQVQEGMLEGMEAGSLPLEPWADLRQEDFFRLVRDHCMQGFYGSPRHGGNRDYMSYRMMGIDFPLLIGRNHYEQLQVKGS